MSRASQVDETVRDLVPVGDAEAAVGGKGALRRAGQEEGLEGRVGFEPTTSRLKVGRSTAELTAPKATPPGAAAWIVPARRPESGLSGPDAATCSSRRPRRRAGHWLTRRKEGTCRARGQRR